MKWFLHAGVVTNAKGRQRCIDLLMFCGNTHNGQHPKNPVVKLEVLKRQWDFARDRQDPNYGKTLDRITVVYDSTAGVIGRPLAADNAWNHGVVLGEWNSGWRALDLAAVRGVASINGAEAGSGFGRDVLGHPLDAGRPVLHVGVKCRDLHAERGCKRR